MMFIDILINLIIQQYLASSRCLIVLTDDANTLEINAKIPKVNVQVYNETFTKSIFHNFGCQEIVIKADDPREIFRIFEKEIKLHDERYNFRKYLFVSGENFETNITDIFQLSEIDYISDVIAIENVELYEKNNLTNNFQPCHKAEFNIWTHKYLGPMNNNEVYMIDKWFSKNQSFLTNNNLFPDKLKNQFGKTLRVATFMYEPYVIIDEKRNDSSAYYGSEILTLKAFANQLNVSLEFVVNENDYWGEIWENWTGNGLMGNLVDDKADVGVAALYTWEAIYHFLDLSKPTIRTGITCLVPAPKLAAGWLTPMYAFTKLMWLAVIVVFVVCVTTDFMIHYFYSEKERSNTTLYLINIYQKALMTIGKVFIQQSLQDSEFSQNSTVKYFMGFMFVLSLILGSCYSSGLAAIMTIPRYENPINTVEDFVQSGIHWVAPSDAWTASIEGADDPNYKEIVSHFQQLSLKQLREISKAGTYAFSLERLPHENFAIGSYIQGDVIDKYHLMQEDFYWEQCVIMARKNSILLPLIDNFILQVFEAGLISYWQNEAVAQYMNPYVQRSVKYFSHHSTGGNKVVKLKFLHVQGAFAILCLGYSISFMVFLLEVLVYQRNKKYFKGFKPKIKRKD